MINFRLTDEELARLRDSSAKKGARSVSEFVRSIVLEYVRTEDSREFRSGVDQRLFSVERTLRGLQGDYQDLLHLLVMDRLTAERAARKLGGEPEGVEAVARRREDERESV
jgi:hypothetical protein